MIQSGVARDGRERPLTSLWIPREAAGKLGKTSRGTMMRFIVRLWLFLSLPWAAALAGVPAFDPEELSNYQSGNSILAACTGITPIQMTSCAGYIEGVADGLALVRYNSKLPPCIPIGVTASQLRDVVVEYLKAHAVTRQLPAAEMVTLSLGEAWCPNPPVQ